MTTDGAPDFSVIVPVYRNEATLPQLLQQMAALSRELPGRMEAVFVVDGSPDNSYALLRTRLGEQPFPAQLVALSRNFGSFAAIRCGMTVSRGRQIAFLAADLQQPVSSVAQFFRELSNGCDIVIGQRATRDDPPMSRFASNVFWSLYRRYVHHDVPAGGVDAFACTRQVRDVLVSLPEANSTLIGLLFWVGFRRSAVSYARVARASGSSGWTLARKLRYAFDSAFAFSDVPITAMLLAGTAGFLIAMVAIVFIVLRWAAGAIPVPGYTALMLAILLSFSVNLLAVGVLGGYVWRVFENTKGRPAHVIRSVEQFDGRRDPAVELS